MTEARLIRIPGQNSPLAGCWCHYCENEWHREMEELDPDGWMSRLNRGMILCPTCGNKRCPKASCHDHACTGSNEPGQPGSVYGDYSVDTSWLEFDDE